MTGSDAGRPTDYAHRLDATVSNWKRKLLDLSRRNRALNFRPTKVSTIAIVDEQPAEVFRRIYIDEGTMRFKAAEEATPPAGRDERSDAKETLDDEPAEDGQLRVTMELDGVSTPIEFETESSHQEAPEFVPYDPASIDERHKDDWLQTTLVPEALDHALRRIEEQARTTIEEQGVNTLFLTLGMLRYRDARDPDTWLRAPLVLLPVELSRKSARAGYSIAATEEDALVNPALVEFLRSGYGVALPELPDSETIDDHYDLQAFLKGATESVADQQGWSVQTDMYLGLFSFQKLVMFKDLDANTDAIGAHRLIQQLLSRAGSGIHGLPDEIRTLSLDAAFTPESTHQVVDADSSQMRAAAAVVKGHDLVIEGPPGTGKSQTITNLIAQALASGKSVLFVAEKMAALDVVHRRLAHTGLGEFCLELHSSKANKRAVMKALSAALDASLEKIAGAAGAGQRIPEVRASLADYVAAVHEPFAPLGRSPYAVAGELGLLLQAPKIKLTIEAGTVSADGFAAAERALRELETHAGGIGNPAEHPWRDTSRTFYSEDDLDLVTAITGKIDALLQTLPADVARAADMLRVPVPATLDELSALADLASKLKAEAFMVRHAEDIAYIEQKSSSLFAFLAVLDGRYRSIKRRWLAWRESGYVPSLLDQTIDLKLVDQATDRRRDLGRDVHRDPAEVVDVAAIRSFITGTAALRALLRELRQAVGWTDGYLAQATLSDIHARVNGLRGSLDKAPAWAAFEASRQRAVGTLAKDAVEAGLAGSMPLTQALPAFRRAFFMKWMSHVIQARAPLHRFDTLSHEGIIQEFRDLDERVLRQNRTDLIGILRDRAQHTLRQSAASACLPRLRREMTKQRQLSPLRRTLRDCDAAIRAIKPCFMMSPLTVAQYLDGSQPTFDLVIFDEASQLPTEDAIGAIIRGRQLVVVGDPKQLPPTNFFSVSSGVVTAPLGDDGTPLYEDSESVLEEFMGAAVPMSRLKWHYRSAHESLISFSNVNFYDADLHTFPSVATDTDAAGLQFHFVDGGIYEGKGINPVEARRIADEVVAFAKLQLARKAAGDAPLSLGVGTLNLRQQLAILDELEVRRRSDPSIEPFFDRSLQEPFFVKNLENIQGDERDAVFLSITYGKSADGRLRYNFGPLNRDNGWRRLNVLVTRARRQMKVFSSIRDHDINPAGATSDGPRLLRAFLTYAEHHRLDGAIAAAAGDAQSPLERDVYLELTSRGVRLQPQVGICGYRVDLGVLDDEVPGRFVCGIECDGVAYHSMETVRDRDRLRQRVLEDRGWIIHRIWSTDWFKDRQGQIDRLLRLIDESRTSVKEESAAHQARDARSVQEQDDEAVQQGAEEASGLMPASPQMAISTSTSTPTSIAPRPGYQRPDAPLYDAFKGSATSFVGDILDAPASTIAALVTRIVEVEGPVHETDVIARVCALWGTKAGSRIQAAIRDALDLATRNNRIQRRGPFCWRPDGVCLARSRAATKIPGDRIAPEELLAALRLVLAGGHAFQRPALITEIRAVMGYSRTGPSLEEAIGATVDSLLAQGLLGEGSGGLVLRTETVDRPAQ